MYFELCERFMSNKVRKMQTFVNHTTVLITIVHLFSGIYAADENVTAASNSELTSGFYPLVWVRIDFRPLIDNERLFRKYKECFFAEHPVGCPRDVQKYKSALFIDSSVYKIV